MPRRVPHLLLVLLACLAAYWPLLGVPGFGSSEGHRVEPAWEMLQSGDWAHQRLFGLTYLRKPPGMPWAIALSSSLLGQTEFAARAVSALASTLMALLACWFTGRWLGRPWGLAAGLVQALLPLFVTIGRTAEIDPLNCLMTQLAAFAMVSLLAPVVAPGRTSGGACLLPAAPLVLCAGLLLAGIVKGPASLPVVLGMVGAACTCARSARPLGVRGLTLGIALAAVLLGGFAWWFTGANRDAEAVLQDFSEFTWSGARLRGTALLLPSAFIAALPASLTLFVPVVHRPRLAGGARDPDWRLAFFLSLAWTSSVLILMLTGSSNARYTMPAGVLLAPLVAWSLRECWTTRHASLRSRLVMLGHPLVWLALLLVGDGFWVPFELLRPRREEGRQAGAAIADVLPSDAVVYANDMIEARPDVLLYARLAAAGSGRRLFPRWNRSAILRGELPPPLAGEPPLFLLLREDEESGEAARFDGGAIGARLEPIAKGRLAKYDWVLLRLDPGPGHR